MIISLIVGIGENREIGHQNQLLWTIKSDLKNFKKLTMGHHIMMGKKTFQSIGKALPGRPNIILSRQKDFFANGCITCTGLEEGIGLAQKAQEQELFVIGGANLYEQALPICHRLYLTQVAATAPQADCYFPPYTHYPWNLEHREEFSESSRDPSWSFSIYSKNPSK